MKAEFDITKVVEEIAMQAKENQEEFIFETIRPYCENILQTKINKEELKQILLNGMRKQQPCEDCISGESVIEWLKDKDIIKTKNQEENARRELAELPSVTPSYNSVKSELKPCDDCISREDALKAIEEQKKGFYGVERYAIDECHSAVMKLPSVRTSQSDGKTSQCDNDVTTCDTEKEKETNTETYIEKDSDLKSDLNSDSEIVEDKRACEKCIHYVTRDRGRVVLCGCDSWECDFEEVKT